MRSQPTKGINQFEGLVTQYDRRGVEDFCKDWLAKCRADGVTPDFRMAKTVVSGLRRKRWFPLLRQTALEILELGQRDPYIERMLAQALIEEKLYAEAAGLLSCLTAGEQGHEAHGLTGRILKQIFLDGKDEEERARTYRLAMRHYELGMKKSPPRDLTTANWFEINRVALSARAEREGLVRRDEIPWRDWARKILDEQRPIDNPWSLATQLEAAVALGKSDLVKNLAERYTKHKGTDAFELGSTARQLIEVWQAEKNQLAMAAACKLNERALKLGQGSLMTLSARGLATGKYEARYSGARLFQIDWLRLGLERAKGVARIEQRQQGQGTGFLVNTADFFPGRKGKLLLTNAHVIPKDGIRPPEACTAHFMALGVTVPLTRVVATSHQDELDYSFIEMASDVGTDPLPLSKRALGGSGHVNVYIIGHPAGRSQEIALNDNLLIASDGRLLHYRTPTEGGSSGSPVFDENEWEVVGLHHAGDAEPKPGVLANEGIAIPAIRKDLERRSKPQRAKRARAAVQ